MRPFIWSHVSKKFWGVHPLGSERMVSKMRRTRLLCKWVQQTNQEKDSLYQSRRGGLLKHIGTGRGWSCCSHLPGAPHLWKEEGTIAAHEDNYHAPTCPNRTKSRYDKSTEVSEKTTRILLQLWKSGSLCQCLYFWEAGARCSANPTLSELSRVWSHGASMSEAMVIRGMLII